MKIWRITECILGLTEHKAREGFYSSRPKAVKALRNQYPIAKKQADGTFLACGGTIILEIRIEPVNVL